MRTAIILGRKHDSEKLFLLSGPEVPIQKQFVGFKEFRKVSEHDSISRVELWTSDAGRIKYRDLDDPSVIEKKEKEAAALKAKTEAEAKKKAEDEAEAKAKAEKEAAALKAKTEAEAKKAQHNPSKK